MRYVYSLSCVAMLCCSLLAEGRDNNSRNAAISFMENNGQVTDQYGRSRTDIQFRIGTNNGLNVFVGNGAMHYQFSKMIAGTEKTAQTRDPHTLPEAATYTMYRMDVELIGANKNARVTKEQPQEFYERYYTTGTGSEGCVSNAYNKITYHDIYPSVDWVLYTTNGSMKHEFVVRPGGKVSDIRMKYTGSQRLQINAGGGLIAATPEGTITEDAPWSYQADGKTIRSAFHLSDNVLSFETGSYEGTLVIDPHIEWASYYGGSSYENNCSIVPDAYGNVYTSGNTQSVASIATTGAFLSTYTASADAFLVKMREHGTRVWATYYGGTANESGDGIAVDIAGNIFMGGLTHSATGIATPGAYQTVIGGIEDGYLVKFDSVGSRAWATYYGGDSADHIYANCVAADGVGNVFIAGQTRSLDSISSTGAWQGAYGGSTDAFIAKFNTHGTFKWGSYYGGIASDIGYGLSADLVGNAFLAGATQSATAIASAGAFLATYAGGGDAFLAKFDSVGNRDWGTYYGGADAEWSAAAKADVMGNVYIAGSTKSTTGIATAGAWQTTYAAMNDGFLAKFDAGGNRLWATYYGGNNEDRPYALAADISNNVYMAGFTTTSTGLATPGAYQVSMAGTGFDAFLVQFSPGGTREWATYFGDTAIDQAFAVGSGPESIVYIAGVTQSPAGIATTGAHQTTYGGGYDGFIAKFSLFGESEVNTHSAQNMAVYPVPASGSLTISTDAAVNETVTIAITDIAGRSVYSGVINSNEHQLHINVAGFAPGMYYVRMTGDHTNTVRKITVVR